MSTDNLKMVIVKDDKILVNEENQEIPKDSIIHCLGSLFKLTESGLSHVVVKLMTTLILQIHNFSKN